MYGGVQGERLPRKRKRGSMEEGTAQKKENIQLILICSQSKCILQIIQFFPMLFQKQNRNTNGSLFGAFGFFFQESFLERGLHISMTGRFIFSGRFIFRWRGHPIGVASASKGGETKKLESGRHPNHVFSHQGKPWFVLHKD